VIFRNLSEMGFQPDDMLFNGGLALRCQSHNVLIERGCSADLADAANWRKAVAYRQAEWRTLWVSHASLSVLYRALFALLRS
jgi:hypothetical protein